MISVQYLNSILPARKPEPSRFKGTRVLLYSPSISPDYPFPATMIDNETLYWLNDEGIRSRPYKLRPEDKTTITNLCDNDARKQKPVSRLQPVRTVSHTRQTSVGNPISALSKRLRTEGISHHSDGERVFFLFDKYYVEHDGKYELYSEKRGLIAEYRSLEKLLEKIIKIDENFDSEKILRKITGA